MGQVDGWQSLAAESCESSIPCLEINAATCGAQIIVPWRNDYVKAEQAGYTSCSLPEQVANWSYQQYIVHADKSRQATLEMIGYVWTRMPVGARLLVCGPNELGIKATLKHAAALCGCEADIIANKKRARVACFMKADESAAPSPIQWQQIPADADGDLRLWSRPGVFSADELDAGTALMQECLSYQQPAAHIVDMACGIGHLGLFALTQWSQATCYFCDADARALACLEKSIAERGIAERCQLQWWSAGETLEIAAADLVLMNPPAHKGKAVDYQAALSMFQQAWSLIKDNGRILIVANRQLPYEKELQQFGGSLEIVMQDGPFKILELRKTA